MQPALSRQIGGNHYKHAAIQPFELTMKNGWDPAAHTILKYVHRHADKGGLLDLQKAHHMVDLRDELRQPTWRERAFAFLNGAIVATIGYPLRPDEDPRISMESYISANRIPKLEAAALAMLDDWVRCQQPDQRGYPKKLKTLISDIALAHYGEAI